jgi:hypothetical protein
MSKYNIYTVCYFIFGVTFLSSAIKAICVGSYLFAVPLASLSFVAFYMIHVVNTIRKNLELLESK